MISFTDHYNAISIDRLKKPKKKKKEKIHGNNSLLCKPEFSSATKTSFLLKAQKTTTFQQVTGANTPNIF